MRPAGGTRERAGNYVFEIRWPSQQHGTTGTLTRAARLGIPATLLIFLSIIPASAVAQTSYPMLMGLKPLAVQIGATTECEVSARYNLFGAYQVFVSGSGVTGEVVPPEIKPDAD
ncbi:MAG TPA: hypothetical protein VGX78_19140, partial [Pirellulales bacterium]|nr:hypothetical protein [Pirellulales bacterium]